MPPSSDTDDFRRILSGSHNIVVVAGAGLSAGSGIPTFRTGNGLWRTHDVTKLATPEAFASDPALVWEFYQERRRTVLSASPNPAHCALALLSIPSYLQAVAPNCTRYTVITQNVDGLSTQAYQEVMSRHIKSDNNTVPPYPPNFFEMHGRVLDTLCTSCDHREHNDANSLCRTSSSTETTQLLLADLPRCTRCSGLLRPGVVWFEEIPHHLLEINKAVETADLCLVIGTSLTVYPAAGFAYDVAEHGGTVAVFDIEKPEVDDFAHFFFPGPCEETLPSILLGYNRI